MNVEFTKYQGLGNDFVLIDNRHQNEPLLTPAQAMQVCDRHFGIGADGVIFLCPVQREATTRCGFIMPTVLNRKCVVMAFAVWRGSLPI